jgi:hypothetical protein
VGVGLSVGVVAEVGQVWRGEVQLKLAVNKLSPRIFTISKKVNDNIFGASLSR